MAMKEGSPRKFIAHADQVLRRIDMYLASGDSAIPKNQVESMVRRIKQMKEMATSGQLPPKEKRHKDLTRIISDSWPLNHNLSSAIAKLETEYTCL